MDGAAVDSDYFAGYLGGVETDAAPKIKALYLFAQ